MVIEKRIRIGKGIVFFDSLQVYVCPMNYFLTIFKNLSVALKGTDRIFGTGEITKVECLVWYKEFSKFTSNKRRLIEMFLDRFNCFGFGEVAIKHLSDEKILFVQSSCHMKYIYENIFGEKADLLPEVIVLGFLKNFVSLVFGKEFKCEMKDSGSFLLYDCVVLENDFEVDDLVEYRYPEFISSFYQEGDVCSSMVRKIFTSDAVSLENGVLRISGANGVILPYFLIFEVFKYNLGDVFFEQFITCLGLAQGKAGVDMHNFFGVEFGESMFKVIIDLVDLSGFGDVSFAEEGVFNKLVFKNNLWSYYGEFYPPEVLMYFKEHVISMLQGAFNFSFKTNSEVIEDEGGVLIFEKISGDFRQSKFERELSKSLSAKVLFTNSS